MNEAEGRRRRKSAYRDPIYGLLEELGLDDQIEALTKMWCDERFVEWFLPAHMGELKVWETFTAGDGELSMGQRSVLGEKLYVRKRKSKRSEAT